MYFVGCLVSPNFGNLNPEPNPTLKETRVPEEWEASKGSEPGDPAPTKYRGAAKTRHSFRDTFLGKQI